MAYTVKQLADLAGVSSRTLHFYDEIGLLKPAAHGVNGYRYYNEADLLRLQQILFYRELDFSLKEIGEILARPDFDTLRALHEHRQALEERVERLERLIHTVDKTILNMQGALPMNDQEYYDGFSEEKQQEYEGEARKRWGNENVDISSKRWGSYSKEKKNQVLAEMHEISAGIADNMERGPGSAEAQAWVARWHRHINEYFYPCSLEVFAGLGRMYVEDPQFRATYEKIRPGMAEFMEQAMQIYCRTTES